MTVSDLLNQIKELPISALDYPVQIGQAKENYPYLFEVDAKKAHATRMENNTFTIYSI